MRTIPFGYEIVNGVITVNEEKAAVLRDMCTNYLNGASFDKCARDAGLNVKHRSISMMLENKTYLGTKVFPQILTEETMNAIAEERKRRSHALGRDRPSEKKKAPPTYEVRYRLKKVPVKYQNPVKQAEYAYSQIKKEVVKNNACVQHNTQ